ncbi:vesicular-fusion protein nsf [Trypanosoma brucei equiperdum]|uniref:Vesicle-fusing ATPase n=1 Tax=Trypanosoma brucei equiperdum TaxID=630700 RepID=A0A3L6LCC2_9TRYP|nr:vesicular-fusion protein nsf [Trypanosoma brucei equiperdum]
MGKSFVVRSVLTDEDSYANRIYLNPADKALYKHPDGVVMIKNYPFTIDVRGPIERGEVAMNSIQRRLVGVTTTAGSVVELEDYVGSVSCITTMHVLVEHVAASKRGGTLDCDLFIKTFRRQYNFQCFRDKQALAVKVADMKLLVTITKLVVENDGTVGQVSENMGLIVRVGEKSEITLNNLPDDQIDAQQPQILQTFNLEGLGIGGLSSEFAQIFRRAFASRLFPQSFVKKVGVKHVKGVLLYGPPGTGKTLIARKIGEILNCRPPKIVNGPEVFSKYVGATEENVRKLFADAEAEAAAKGDQSQLHLIIFDEFDSICKQRGATRDSTGVNDNVVNQLLSKIDGVNSLNNVLLIGMTNRIDLIDEAILRPGRFEVHVEIGLPNEKGRVEILRIHTRGMQENKVLGKDVDIEKLAALTKNYSGAELEGVVRSASSNAFNRHINLEDPSEIINPQDVFVTQNDFLTAIEELKPAFGQAKEECNNLKRGGIINYGKEWVGVEDRCRQYVDQLKSEGKRINTLTVLIDGRPGSGKSAVAAHLADMAGFPYVRVISNEDMVGYGEAQKVNIIRKAFDDAGKSPFSTVILDDVERIIEFSYMGGRYSNAILQALLVLIKRPPPNERKLLVVATTSMSEVMDTLELTSCFSVKMHVPCAPQSALEKIAQEMGLQWMDEQTKVTCKTAITEPMPIKQMMLLLEMSAEKWGTGQLTIMAQTFSQALDSIAGRSE